MRRTPGWKVYFPTSGILRVNREVGRPVCDTNEHRNFSVRSADRGEDPAADQATFRVVPKTSGVPVSREAFPSSLFPLSRGSLAGLSPGVRHAGLDDPFPQSRPTYRGN